MLAEKQPGAKRTPLCKFWCNSLAHVIHNCADAYAPLTNYTGELVLCDLWFKIVYRD